MRAGYLVTRVVLVWLLTAGAIEPGVTRVLDGVLVAIGLTAVNTLFTTLFAMDDEDFWYSHVVRRQARRAPHFRHWLVALGHDAYR